MAMRAESVTVEDDPVWRAVLAAPMGPPPTDEESAAYDTLLRDVRAGRHGVGHEVVLATIEEMRAEQGDEPDP